MGHAYHYDKGFDMRRLWSVEQDGGLWLVGIGNEDDKDFCQLGYVWNEGYMPEERKGKPYRACEDWDSCVPTKELGEAPTWMGAVKILLANAREAMGLTSEEPVVSAVRRAQSRAGVFRIPVSFPEEQAYEFAASVATDYRDTIWQPDWHALRGRAYAARQGFLDHKNREGGLYL